MRGAIIRSFDSKEIEAVYEIEGSSFRNPWPKSLFRALHRSKDVNFLVARLEGKTVGYIVGRIERDLRGLSSANRRLGHIMNIAVSPDLRRSGIGTKLMRALENFFRKEGVKHIMLEVRVSNLSAQRFYEEMGYRTMGRAPGYYLDEDAIIMERNLR